MKIGLRHDALAARIYGKVSAEEINLQKVENLIRDRYQHYLTRKVLMKRDDLDFIRPYINQIEINGAEQIFIKRSKFAIRKKNGLLVALAILILIIISGAAIYANIQKNISENEKNKAERQKEVADSLRLEANALAYEADSLAQVALEEKEKAERERDKAILAEKKAREAQHLAEAAKNQADISAREADSLAQVALEEKEKAERERDKAIFAEKKAQEKARAAYLLSAQSMATKSFLIEDRKLKALVAQQAYLFNEKYRSFIIDSVESKKSSAYDPNIYRALYEAIKRFKGNDFNVINDQGDIVRALIFDAKGEYILSTGSGGILQKTFLNNLGSPQIINKNAQNINKVMALNPIEETLIIAGQYPYIKRFTSIIPETIPQLIKYPSSEILDLAYFPDGKSFLSVGIDDTIRIHNSPNFEPELFAAIPQRINSICISQHLSNMLIVGAGEDGMLYIWRDTKNSQLEQLAIGKGNAFQAVTISPDGKILAAGDIHGNIFLVDISEMRLLYSLVGHKSPITSIAFSNNNDKIASGSYDGTVRMWVLNHLSEPPIIMEDYRNSIEDYTNSDGDGWIMALSFTNDDRYLIAGSEKRGRIRRWPTDLKILATQLYDECIQKHIRQSMNSTEWYQYAGEDTPYEDTLDSCKVWFENR